MMNKERAEMELAGEMREMISLGWTYEEALDDMEGFLERLGEYADGLTEEEILDTWKQVWEQVMEEAETEEEDVK